MINKGKKDTRGDIMPILLLVLTFSAVLLIHFLPIFGSIFLAYCSALWCFALRENNIQLDDGVPAAKVAKIEKSHEFEENRLAAQANFSKAISKDSADYVSHFASRLVPPPAPTRHTVQITLTPRLVQSPNFSA
ncbi:hypothetical protein [Sulfuriferula nivalis]|uniref:hypothetical protein n=1 Tax=Sulfuriferula nivalis TaxID=2675298 RepID=UPI00138A5FDE|nr:hypothetical protein [Sulfuriferula nivalis]